MDRLRDRLAGPVPARFHGRWATYPALEDLFAYNGSGVMPGRTWVIAPDADSLLRRWQTLIKAKADQKEALFVPHLRNGESGDKHAKKRSGEGHCPVSNHIPNRSPSERGECVPPIRYGFRSFDRQWIIPDNRVINQPNPELWRAHSEKQIYLTALHRTRPRSGPAFTFTGLIPDLTSLQRFLWRSRFPALARSRGE